MIRRILGVAAMLVALTLVLSNTASSQSTDEGVSAQQTPSTEKSPSEAPVDPAAGAAPITTNSVSNEYSPCGPGPADTYDTCKTYTNYRPGADSTYRLRWGYHNSYTDKGFGSGT